MSEAYARHEQHNSDRYRLEQILSRLDQVDYRLNTHERGMVAMTSSFDDERQRLANDLSAIKQKFDALNAQVQTLTNEQNTAAASQAAQDAASLKTDIDNLEASWGVGGPIAAPSAPSDPQPTSDPAPAPGTTPDSGSGTGTGASAGDPNDPNAGAPAPSPDSPTDTSTTPVPGTS